MECQRCAKSLVVLTLLQLCRAEIKDTQPQWYSANVINDGFQPKSISEIFATEASFSTANPIIVSSISDDDIQLLSTSAPPIISSSTTFPSTSLSDQFSTFSSSPSPLPESSSRSTDTSPLLSSTSKLPSTQIFSTSTSPRVTVTPFSTIGSSIGIASSTGGNTIANCMIPTSTPVPILTDARSVPLPVDQFFPIRIRVKAPSGSITNVNFNPMAKNTVQPVSTQKYIATTTTRKPTTRRTPKPRKNTYERCLQGCRKNGQSLCAAPLSQFPVDPKTLRGFPSVCHMACHNSYRKDAYEKVIDGSCSRLRTRIRPVDSNSKLKRDELQKVQYFLDNSEQQPIFEFTGTYS